MLLLGEQDFAASGHDSFDANSLVMVTLRQATSTHLVEAVAVTLQFRHMARCDELRAELERLQVGELRQFASSNTVGEPRVVFDLRAGAGLSSRPDSVEHQG